MKSQPLSPLSQTLLTIKYCTPLDKYSQTCSLVSKYLINNIISPLHYINAYRINFQEIQLVSDHKEYLKRYYLIDQYNNKNTALTQYYKFHKDFPYHIDLEVGLVMMVHQQSKNKYHRKFIKKLINEPISLSTSQKSLKCLQKNDQNKNTQYSIKLKGLQQQQSSIILQQLCQKIQNAFQHIKPSYFYRGVYNDHANSFRQYLISQKFKKSKISYLDSKDHKDKKSDIDNASIKYQPNTNRTKQGIFKIVRNFSITRPFRKTVNHQIISYQAKKYKKSITLSKLKKNKTLTIKPHSSSKINQTISKDEYHDPIHKKRQKNQIRIKKCKSTTKSILTRNKSIINYTKILELDKNKQNKQNQQKNIKKQLSQNKLKYKNYHKPSNQLMYHQPFQKIISRTISKKGLIKIYNPKQIQKQIQTIKSKAIHTLIKNKLQLRV